MASIHRRKDSSLWHCAYYLPDGRRTLRSTGTSDKEVAKRICLEYAKAAKLGREGRLTEARAREAIADIYEIANRDKLPSSTIKAFLDEWTARKKPEVSEASYNDYVRYSQELQKFLGEKCSRSLDVLTVQDLNRFRNSLSSRVSGTTVNKILKILRGAWARAVRDGLVRENPFGRIDFVKASKARRRAFTWPELQTLLSVCDQEWRGMVLFGLYTGQRLGDIARVTWRSIDLQTKEWRFMTIKTKRNMALPLHDSVVSHLLSMNVPDDPETFVFPEAAKTANISTSTLSNRFSDLLYKAGLGPKKSHKTKGKGRDGIHSQLGLSFHCLRHTATSLLKNAGISDVVAREIVGHESAEISRVYTHIEIGTLRDAVNKLPDVSERRA
jgi:integrase